MLYGGGQSGHRCPLGYALWPYPERQPCLIGPWNTVSRASFLSLLESTDYTVIEAEMHASERRSSVPAQGQSSSQLPPGAGEDIIMATMQSPAATRPDAMPWPRQTHDNEWSVFTYRESLARERAPESLEEEEEEEEEEKQEEDELPGSEYVLVSSDTCSRTLETDYMNDNSWLDRGQRMPPNDGCSPSERLSTCQSGNENDGSNFPSYFLQKNCSSDLLLPNDIEKNASRACHDHDNSQCCPIGSQKTLLWLSDTDPSWNHYLACQKRLDSTGSWILDLPQYSHWQSSSNSMLWLHGKPGAGKTIITSLIVDNLRARIDDHRDTLAFFYAASKNGEKQRPLDLLRSIVAQLASKLPYLPESLCVMHTLYQNSQPPVQHLKQALSSILQDGLETYIVIDGLDEYTRGAEREEMLNLLQEVSSWSLANLHILATSRREHDIENVLMGLSTSIICIQTPELDADIVRYIKHQIATRPRLASWPQDVKTEIETKLISGADGMFLWVSYQIETLEGCLNTASIYHALNAIPKELDQTYARIILDINENYKCEMRRALMWLSFSQRDLRIDELAETIAIDPSEDPQFDPKKRVFDPYDILYMLSSLVYISQDPGWDVGGSTKVSQGTTIVRFVHRSVKDFLVSGRVQQNKLTAIFGFTALSANDFIAESCAVIIMICSRAGQKTRPEFIERYPLLKYACQHWYSHAQVTDGKTQKSQSSPTRRLMSSRAALLTWLQIYRPDYPSQKTIDEETSQASQLYYASFLGFFEMLEDIVTAGADINAPGGYYGSALQAAAVKGYGSIVQFLLERGADVNARCGYYGTALQAACVKGHDSLIQHLLDHGADPNAQGGHYGNALVAASRGGHTSIISCLLQHGAKIAAIGFYGPSVLRRIREEGADIREEYPATNRHSSVQDFTRLDSKDCYISDTSAGTGWRSRSKATALHVAAAYNQDSAIQELLLHGISCTGEDSDQWTALHWASESGADTNVLMLLKYGAKVNHRDNEGRSSLSWAAGCGHAATAKLLLGHGAEVDSPDVEGQTPLSWAAARGHLTVVSLLLAHGAAIESIDAEGQSPLSWAAWNGHEAVVKLLLEHGADIESKDFTGRTPLFWATLDGHEALIKILLSANASVDVRDTRDGSTPLLMALEHRHDNVVQLLLDAGAKEAVFIDSQCGELPALRAGDRTK